jgi:PAS domain S-box-containing protein
VATYQPNQTIDPTPFASPASPPAQFNQPDAGEVTQLRAVNRHLRQAVDQIDEGVIILETGPIREPGPRIVFLNRGLLAMTGYEFSDLLGQPVAALYDPERLQDLLSRLPAVAKLGKAYQIRTEICCRNGTTKACVWKISAAQDDHGRPVNFIFSIKEIPSAEFSELPAPTLLAPLQPMRNEVAVRVLEPPSQKVPSGNTSPAEAMAPAREKPEDICIQKSRMYSLAMAAGGIAHDFKNVLTSIMANLSLAKLEAGGGTRLREHIDDAATAAVGAKDLTDQLLNYAKGGEHEKVSAADIGKLLKDAAKLSTYGAQVECRLDVPADLWSAPIDYTQITQVVNNLIINARQAMAESGVIQASLRNVNIRAFDPIDLHPGKYVKLSVIDHGCGIPPANLTDIFKSFYTTKSTGTGLGLATCFSIVLKHRGLITVDSDVGHGTEFNVYLPATGEIADRGEEIREDKIYHGEGTVLVVDDLLQVRTVASALLTKLGYEVVLAESGEEALVIYKRRALEGRPINVILMDMTLPGGMSGQDSTKEILRHDPFARVIATSGYFDDSGNDQFVDLGFTSVVSKPYDLPTLSLSLHRALKD